MVENCCALEPNDPPVPQRTSFRRRKHCPDCGRPATRVPPEPVAFYVPNLERTGEESFFLCENPDCPVVYFDNTGRRWDREAVTLRFGFKERKGPRLVCYCFGHTEEEIAAELRVHGKATVPDRIRAEIAAGTCECEFRNPRGRCCLGEVTATTKRLMASQEGERP